MWSGGNGLRAMRGARAYGIAVLATAVCFGLRWLFWPILGEAIPHMAFLPAVLLSAFVGGLGPGLLATVLGVSAANYVFTEQLRLLQITSVNDIAGAALFVVTGAIVSGLGEALHREQRRTWAKERQLARAQLELAQVNRVMTMGQLTASIAHEVNQPITGVLNHARAGLRWLRADPPNLAETFKSIEHIISDGTRAGEIVNRIGALVKRTPPRQDWLHINDVILEVLALTHTEIQRHGIVLETQLGKDLPPIKGDRVQLQQVMLNLIVNAIETMNETDRRALLIKTSAAAAKEVIVEVEDTGPELKSGHLEHLFDPFYTTKPTGMGMGLAICRSIVEAHGGRISASAKVPNGAVFRFTLPGGSAHASS